MCLIQTCTPDGHLYTVTYTRCIDTINSPDDGHMAARNMQRTLKKELCVKLVIYKDLNPLNDELNPICYLLALLGDHHFLHVSRITVKSLTLRQLMSYIYMEHLFLMFLDHTQRRTTVGRTPLDE